MNSCLLAPCNTNMLIFTFNFLMEMWQEPSNEIVHPQHKKNIEIRMSSYNLEISV